MVSVLGNYDYCFPVKIKLKKTMFDLIDMNKIDCVIDVNNLLQFSEFVCYPQINGELYNSNYTRVWINRYIGALTCSKMPTAGIEKNGKLYVHKLSTKEAWSFMGFNENDYYKAKKINSEIQLYKQAGNSIVKNVLMAIFNQLF